MKSGRAGKSVIIILGVTVSLFAAVLVGTPYLLDLGLERWIVSRGVEVGRIENIDFNPFTGRLSMDNLVVETRSGRTLSITKASLAFSWKQLFKKRLYLRELTLYDAYMLVDKAGDSVFRAGGFILPDPAAPKKEDEPGWEAGIDVLTLQNATIEYDTPELEATFHLDQYSLKGLETWNKEKKTELKLRGRVNESTLQIRAEGRPLGVVKTWKGRIVLAGFPLELFAKMEGLKEYNPAGIVDLDLDLEAQMNEDNSMAFAAGGTAGLRQFHATDGSRELQQGQLTWKGSLEGERSAAKDLSLALEGQLKGARLVLDNSTSALHLQLGAFSWQGKARVGLQQEKLSIDMGADFAVSDIEANDREHAATLLALKKLDLRGIEIAGLEDIRVAETKLGDLRLPAGKATPPEEAADDALPLLQTAAISISSVRLQDTTGIAVDRVELQNTVVAIKRDKDGSWQEIPLLTLLSETPAPQQAAAASSKETGAEKPVQFRLNSLRAAGSTLLHFTDNSLQRPYKSVVQVSELELGGFNPADSDAVSTFTVKGQVDDYGKLAADGTVLPADTPLSAAAKGSLRAFDMVPLSSYIGEITGYNVSSGQMDADITMKIDKGVMDGIVGLRMRNLEVARLDPEKTPNIENRLDMPLGSALAMLRNKKDEINLELELQGDIKSVEVGFQDVINQALAKAMKLASLSYLKYTLQPFGTYLAIAEVVGKAGKKMSRIGLEPLAFAAGETGLDETAVSYLEKIGALLENRPQLKIEVCGMAAAKDRTAVVEQVAAAREKEAGKNGRKGKAAAEEIVISDERLLELAEERAKLAKEAMITKHAIAHERIFLCHPEIDADPAGEPRVVLRLD